MFKHKFPPGLALQLGRKELLSFSLAVEGCRGAVCYDEREFAPVRIASFAQARQWLGSPRV